MAQRHDENYNEQPMTRMGRIQQPSRRYRRLRHPSFTAAIWTANNPLLQRGEIGGEIDTHRIKMGDGVTYWNDLPYASDSIATWGDIQGSISDQTDLQNALGDKQDVLTAGAGIGIDSDNVISNSGVRSVSSGTANGTISVNTNGTSADVAVTGLGSAAYTSSSDYANTALSNLTSTGANIGNWSSNVSNCITEIPQDIKLELSSGTLTLKAGSKLHMADGNLEVTTTISADITRTSTYNGQYMIILYGNAIFSGYVDSCLSGTIANRPNSTAHTAGIYFATDENKIYVTNDSGATWAHAANMSMPLAVITVSNGAISSIDQVFNGFGYIGSTIYVLPGVKYLRADGRNADGTLKSILSEISSVKTVTASGTYSDLPIILGNNAIALFFRTYDEKTNKTGTGEALAIVGKINVSSGAITGLSVKTSFHAVDYSDSDYIANCAMPSDRYIDLSSTTITDGLTLTAPAGGYYSLYKVSTAAGQMIGLVNTNTGFATRVFSSDTSETLGVFIPVSKGQTIMVRNSLAGSTTYFRFIYDNGSK